MNKKKIVSLIAMVMLIMSMLLPSGVVVTNAESNTPKVIGDKDNPKITITKLKQEPGSAGKPSSGQKEENPNGDPVQGVVYEVKQTKKLLPGALSTDGWQEKYEDVTKEAKTYTTNEAGIIALDQLELGVYEIKEISGPSDILINPTPFTVELPMTTTDGTTLNYDIHVYPKNEIIRGNGEFQKQDGQGNGLPGVKFNLYDETGKQLGETMTTGTEGKIKLEGLAAGKYYLQEIDTVDGYALDHTKIHFEVTASKNDEDKNVSSIIWEAQENPGTFKNYKQPEIDKKIKDENGQLVTDLDAVRNKEFTYQLKINVPQNIQDYKALGVTDTLDSRLEFTGEWTVTGTTKENIKFQAIDAEDSKGHTTKQLIWEVVNLSQLTTEPVVIDFSTKIRKDAQLVEGENGISNTANLHFDNGKGSYTKPADPVTPPGPETPPVTPPTTPPVTVKPVDGGLKILKVDANDQTVKLKGAEFKITADKEGKQVLDTVVMGTVLVNGQNYEGKLENLVTDTNGIIKVEGLNPGTYYIHETKAPTYQTESGEEKSYRLLTKPLKVEVVKSEVQEVTVENAKSGWNLPTTGGIGTLLFTLVGFTMILASILLYVRRKKEESVAL